MKMQVLREIRHITQWRDNAIYRTAHVAYAWVDDDLGSSNDDEIYCSLSTADVKARNYVTIRMVDPSTPSIVKEN